MRQKNLLLPQCLSPSQREVILNQVIDQLQRFGLAKERDYELVDHTFTQWRKSNRLNTQKSTKKLGKDLKGDLDGETLEHLVNERQIRDQLTSETLSARTAKKSVSKKPPLRHPKSQVHFDASPTSSASSSDWPDSSSDSNCSIQSTITLQTPVIHQQPSSRFPALKPPTPRP